MEVLAVFDSIFKGISPHWCSQINHRYIELISLYTAQLFRFDGKYAHGLKTQLKPWTHKYERYSPIPSKWLNFVITNVCQQPKKGLKWDCKVSENHAYNAQPILVSNIWGSIANRLLSVYHHTKSTLETLCVQLEQLKCCGCYNMSGNIIGFVLMMCNFIWSGFNCEIWNCNRARNILHTSLSSCIVVWR